MTVAPAAWAIWRAKMETPPVPWTTTVWPGKSGLREYNAFHALDVKTVQGGGEILLRLRREEWMLLRRINSPGS